jgi:hypothetical protein
MDGQMAVIAAYESVEKITSALMSEPMSVLLIMTDQELPALAYDLIRVRPSILWTFGFSCAPSSWIRSWRTTEWLKAIDDLNLRLQRQLGGLRLSPGSGLLNESGSWFYSPALESLLVQYPEPLPMRANHRRAVRAAMKRNCDDVLTLTLDAGGLGSLMVKSEANHYE